MVLALTLAVAGASWLAAGPARAVAVLVVATPCPSILAAPRGLLYGLHAILRLHTAQEEESYLSLGDGPEDPASPGPAAIHRPASRASDHSEKCLRA